MRPALGRQIGERRFVPIIILEQIAFVRAADEHHAAQFRNVVAVSVDADEHAIIIDLLERPLGFARLGRFDLRRAALVVLFLSLADVHINRSPYGGRVTSVTYRPGRFLAAFRAESALENERSEITVEREVAGGPRRIVYRQIVGLLARRVVTRVRPGDDVPTGARIGLMKFGSRMDVFVPPEVSLEVVVGQRVRAGETVLGHWRAS